MGQGKANSYFCAEGLSRLPRLPGAKMALICHSALNSNRTGCIYTADACGNTLSKKCDISGGEWQRQKRVCQHTSLLSFIYRASSVQPSKCQQQHCGLKSSPYCKHCNAWTVVSAGREILQGVPQAEKAYKWRVLELLVFL